MPAINAVAFTRLFFVLLFKQRPGSSGGNAASTAPAPTSAPVAPVRNTASAEEITAVTGLVTAIGNGGGGTVNYAGLDININGVAAPLVYINNEGQNAHSSGNITVHIGDRNSEDDMSTVHHNVSPSSDK